MGSSGCLPCLRLLQRQLSLPPTFHGPKVALWPQYVLQRLPEGEEVNEAITTHLPGPQNDAPHV